MIVSIGIFGCATLTEDSPTPDASDIIHRTIVRYLPDGSFEQSFETITLTEQQAEFAARATLIETSRLGTARPSELLQQDSGCAGSSLWLFSATNLGGDQLCLFRPLNEGFSELNLGTVCRIRFEFRCIATWSDAIRSLWAGSDPGNILACDSNKCFTGFGNSFGFSPFERINTITAGVSAPRNIASLFVP